ncbi:MAG: isoprenyl transferase [Candidatus Marinimicrobia bacterium]|nr:isoprenyl transferase [Candidatus Neomarinimicrobiota bacterium]
MSNLDKNIEKIRNEILAENKIPEHIAIIMDGNGRWAKKRKKPRIFGHNEGINSVREVVEECGKLGVKYLTLYTFSVENWGRPQQEVTGLMQLLLRTIKKEVDELNRNNVKLSIIGRIDDLPEKPKKSLLDGVKKTSLNTGLNLILALSYSSRQEILDGIKKLVSEYNEKGMPLDDITEMDFSRSLYTGSVPDPDLLIRTSGEMRLSNFLLWQLAYTEFYITDVLWPDFRSRELFDAILDYNKRERRFGKTSEQITKDKG